MKRFKNGVGRHKGKNISLIERNGQPALRVGLTKRNGRAKKQEAVEGFYGIYHYPRGYYQAIDANGRKHGSYPDADEAARKRDEIMMAEYFHNESGEELHCFGFIHWNDFQSVYDCYDSQVMESDYYLIDEVKQATKASEHLMKEKGWTI